MADGRKETFGAPAHPSAAFAADAFFGADVDAAIDAAAGLAHCRHDRRPGECMACIEDELNQEAA